MLFITILLLIIAVILLGILVKCMSSYRDTQEHLERIHNEIFNNRRTLQDTQQIMAIEVRDIAENVKSIDRALTDIKFSQDKLEKYLDKHDINEAIKMLESIDVSLMDLKDIHNTLSSLESSLEIITAHPAFTKHKHDDDLF